MKLIAKTLDRTIWRCRCGNLFFCFMPLLFCLLTIDASAGRYVMTYSGGRLVSNNSHRNQSYQFQSDGNYGVTGYDGGSGNLLDCSGEITVTGTWVPDFPNDAPPDDYAVVQESSVVYAVSAGYVADPIADNGVGTTAFTTFDISKTNGSILAGGIAYQTIDNPGALFTYKVNPHVHVTGLNYSQAAVLYQALVTRVAKKTAYGLVHGDVENGSINHGSHFDKRARKLGYFSPFPDNSFFATNPAASKVTLVFNTKPNCILASGHGDENYMGYAGWTRDRNVLLLSGPQAYPDMTGASQVWLVDSIQTYNLFPGLHTKNCTVLEMKYPDETIKPLAQVDLVLLAGCSMALDSNGDPGHAGGLQQKLLNLGVKCVVAFGNTKQKAASTDLFINGLQDFKDYPDINFAGFYELLLDGKDALGNISRPRSKTLDAADKAFKGAQKASEYFKTLTTNGGIYSTCAYTAAGSDIYIREGTP